MNSRQDETWRRIDSLCDMWDIVGFFIIIIIIRRTHTVFLDITLRTYSCKMESKPSCKKKNTIFFKLGIENNLEIFHIYKKMQEITRRLWLQRGCGGRWV